MPGARSGSGWAPRPNRTAFYALAAFAAGICVSGQSRINGQLAVALANSTLAAVISFTSGLLILTVMLLLLPGMRRGLLRLPAALRTGDLAWWQLIGGVGGGFFVAVQTAVVPTIGVALFAVSAVAGQTANSLLVDKVGLGPAGRAPITTRRTAAAAIAVIAVLVSVSDKLGNATFSLVAVALGFVAGAGTTAQQAINGRVSVAARSPFSATWLNFAVGSLFLLALLGFRGGGSSGGVATSTSWWLYTGGALGIVFISTSALVIGHLGVLLFSLCIVSGQVIGALAIDLIAPAHGESVTATTVLGAALTLVAVAIGGNIAQRLRAARA